MLLCPRSAHAAVVCPYYLCTHSCASSNYMLLSYYSNAICACGKRMKNKMNLSFLKGPSQLIISDELRVVPASSAASFSLLSKLGIMDGSAIEARSFIIGIDQVLKLLNCSIVSKRPLTEFLLGNSSGPGISENDFEQGSSKKPKLDESTSNQNGKIVVKLMISKSMVNVSQRWLMSIKNMVCYGEASEKFVDLLFSFLTIPLGFIVKEMQEGGSKGCINHLYDSIQDLDAMKYLVSKETTAMLISPKLAPGFSYEGQTLDIEEYMHQPYYLISDAPSRERRVTSVQTRISSGGTIYYATLTAMYPKSHYNDNSSRWTGFLKGPAMFTIADDLIISPLSTVTGLSAVRKLKVPFNDIEERIVYIGKEEALCLMVASLVSENALTNTFLLKESNQGS